MQVLKALSVAIMVPGVSVQAMVLPMADSASIDTQRLAENALKASIAGLATSSTEACTNETVSIRKSWDSLTADERIEYIDAVRCLQSQKARTPSELAPGAKTRYDDFIATHINQTNYIHFTASFLSWHRWFTWEYEQALRNECNYTGTQPYWDWTQSAKTGLAKYPLFDGSATSLSGDGAPVEHLATDRIIFNPNTTLAVYLTPGNGGGCVTSGPFVNMTVNFAPVNMALLNSKTIESTNKFDYQPRCLKRNLMDDAIKRFANDTSVSTLLADPQDIAAFQDMMQGNTNRPDMGVHGGGHYSLGGDPSLDQFVSPGDPAFFTHHSMIDRVWWIWQMQNPESRASTASAVAGPYTLQDLYEPHRNGTVDDVLDLGYVAEGKNFRIEQLLSTTDGPFCYVYI